MLKTLSRVLFASIVMAATASCAFAEEKPAPKKPKSFSGSYLSGMFAKRAGLDKEASAYLGNALSTSPENTEVQLLSFRLQLAEGNMDKAVELANALSTKKANDPLVVLMLVSDDIKHKRFAEAGTHLTLLDEKGYNEILTPILQAWINYGKGEVKSPVVLDEVVKKTSGSPTFVYFQLALINDLAGFKKEALDYYLKATDNSQNVPYRIVVALGNFYEREGRKADAEKLYKDYLAQNLSSVMGNDTEIFSKAEEEKTHPVVSTAADGVAELYSILAGLFYTESSAQESLYYLRLALHMKPDFPATQLMLGDLLAEKGNRAAAETIYESISRESYYYRQGQIKKAFNLDAMGKLPDALSLLDTLAKAYPQSFEPLLSKGDILRDRKKFAEAAEAYSQSIATISKVENRHWPMFYVRGICYERAGKWELAEKDFFKALDLEPGQPEVLNYLGYSWLVMGKNVAKAKGMIETAIAARPEDAHIIDSMGWALFTLGEYDGAVEYLEQAVEIKPHDTTINDHLGDAYWRVGRKLEAKFQWERALSFNPEEKNESETIRKKIQSGLPAEKPKVKEQAADAEALSDSDTPKN